MSEIAAPARATLISTIERLEEIIDIENAAYEARTPLDLDEINRRKSRGLLELTRAARQLPDAGERPGGDLLGGDRLAGERLAALRGKLERNQYLLSVRLAAAREVSGILDHALRAAESDGTYSAHPARDGESR